MSRDEISSRLFCFIEVILQDRFWNARAAHSRAGSSFCRWHQRVRFQL